MKHVRGLPDQDCAVLFLDYFNNFLSVERFAEVYGYDLERAGDIIELGRETHEANVKRERLIAAAPEMLDALESMRAYLLSITHHVNIHEATRVELLALDVIKRARGEQGGAK